MLTFLATVSPLLSVVVVRAEPATRSMRSPFTESMVKLPLLPVLLLTVTTCPAAKPSTAQSPESHCTVGNTCSRSVTYVRLAVTDARSVVTVALASTPAARLEASRKSMRVALSVAIV